MVDELGRGAREERHQPVVLFGVVDDRSLERAEKMSRTTRTERSASWKTRAGAGVSATRFWSTSLSLNRYSSSRSRSARLAPWAAVRMIAPAPLRSSFAASLRSRSRSLSSSRRETPTPSPYGRVDHVAAGDREVHREPRALGLQRVLDDLDDDLLAGLEHVGDLPAVARRCRGRGAAPRRRAARSRRRAESRSSPGRCRRTRLPGRRGRCRPGPCRCCRRSSGRRGAPDTARRRGSRRPGSSVFACGARCSARLAEATVPVASSSATRVSPRSTLTSTCFFNCHSVLYEILCRADEAAAALRN